MSRKSISRTLLSISGLVVLAKVLGFVKQMIVADAFGATLHTDIISISEGLISNIDYLLIQTLATAFIPTYIHLRTADKEKSRRFVSDVIKVFLIVTVIIAAMFWLASPLISKLLAPSYDGETSARLSVYIKLFAPVLILIVGMSVFTALLKAEEIFVPCEFIGVNQSIIIIAIVLLAGSVIGPDALVISFYLYAAINLVFLMVYSRKYWIIQRGNPFKNEDVHKLIVMMVPLLLGYSVVFINQQVDKIIVSGLGEGTVTAMGYAAVLSNFVSTFIGSFAGVLFTYITKNVAEKNDKKAADLTGAASAQLITIMLPISILTIANSHDIVSIVFGHGKFDSTAIGSCSAALIGYGCMFVPLVLRELFSRFQYAYGDSKRPMINSTISIVFNIALSILLSIWFGVLGVTLATSISVLICAILNICTSKKHNNEFRAIMILKQLPRWLIGGVFCVGITVGGQVLLGNNSPIIRFVLITIISFLFYGAANFSTLKSMVLSVLKRS